MTCHDPVERKIRGWLSIMLIGIGVVIIAWQYREVQRSHRLELQAQRDKLLAQEAQRRERLRAELIIASSRYGQIMCDDNQLITFANPAAEQAFGWPAGELVGQNVKVLIPDEIQTEHYDRSVEAAQAVRQTPGNWVIRKNFVTKGLAKDGTLVDMGISVRAIKYGEEVEFIAEVELLNKKLPPTEVEPLPPIEERMEKRERATKQSLIKDRKI